MTGTADDRRQVWQKSWEQKKAQDFQWHVTEVPEQLTRVLDTAHLPVGAALDLGCGAGVATAHLARRRQPTIGIDIALGAVREARRRVEKQGDRASFVVADAANLPFRPRSLAFVFDRGCLQNLPRESWPQYFAECERVLAPGAILQLLCSKAKPVLLSRRGLRSQLRRVLGRPERAGGPQFLSHDLLRRLTPATMEPTTMEDFVFVTATGKRRVFTHGLFVTRGP